MITRSARQRPGRRLAIAAAALLATTAGCGVGAGEQADGVHLRVSDDFGARIIAEPGSPKQSGADTVMRLLQRNAKVETRYGGGFVQAINGLRGQADAGKQIDWFYFVNGVQAGRGAADWRVRPGDRVWWDRHRWDLDSVSAVVGDYPEPMLSGHDGQWVGALLDCRADSGTCDAAREQLGDAKIRVTDGAALATDSRQTRVLVGPWADIQRAAPEATQLAGGPGVSGVFAKVGARGVATVDARGRAAKPSADAGLVAALRTADHSPLWIVTGATDAAVAAAVRALGEGTLSGLCAAVVRDERAYALPTRTGDPGREVRP